MTALDHLILAAPDLERTVAWLEDGLGIRLAPGGSHPTAGTRNFLLGLGDSAYLEVLGPDTGQSVPREKLPFGLGRPGHPRLCTWALRVTDVDARVAAARAAGHDPGEPATMSRVDPRGGVVSGRITPPRAFEDGGLLPFLVDWGTTPHPARDLPRAELAALHGYHPAPDPVRHALRAVEADLTLRRGSRPALVATVRTPDGELTLI
ncbi:VOC family protein [Streptomyces sp. NBC_01022]|uniref:VOC family protein n=1 Tax=Streptomyces sp. NBC_01022 TaxID=2903723 RepID=UPI002DDB0A4C|nr:VOC family protein [Streptomyces sp. NBC_01022]WRZ84042.1 VOC family protein [Streptomyces sp. NBC_01022]